MFGDFPRYLGLKKKISYDLNEPQDSLKQYEFNDKCYNIYDEDNNIQNGMVVKGERLINKYGAVIRAYIYFGVSKQEYEFKEGEISTKEYYLDSLNEKFYLFQYESETDIEFKGLSNQVLD